MTGFLRGIAIGSIALFIAAACGSSETGGTSGGTTVSSSATTTSSSSTGGAGTGGTASTGGAGGAISTGGTGVGGVGGGIGGAGGKLPTCKHCADAIGPQGTSMGLCTDSTVLYEALSTCLCLPTNCGMSCQKSCTGAGMNSGCAQCEQTADTGACKTQYDACAADTP